MKKYYFILTFFMLFFTSSCLLYNVSKSEDSNVSSDTFDKLISSLEKAKTMEERKAIFSENRDMIDSSLIIKVLSMAKSSFDPNSFSFERQKVLGNIAIEMSEFFNDKVNLAQSLLFYSKFDVKSLEKALCIFKELGDKKGEALCYYKEASLLNHVNDYEKIMILLDKSIGIGIEIEDKLLQADSYKLKGKVWSMKMEREKSLENFNKAIGIYESLKNYEGIVDCYKDMASICQNTGMLEDAEKFHKLRIELVNDPHLKDGGLWSKSLVD